MGEVAIDPETLLEWLKADGGIERDIQIAALEQLCMVLLISDNIDRCFEQYQPRLYLPALCDIFNDPLAPTNVLEVTARALTYFLDVSVDCAKKITQHQNGSSIRAMCHCLQVVDIDDRTNKDLAEQCIKVLERICSREASSIYEVDGLHCVLDFINNWYYVIHKDTLQSALNVVVKLIGRIDPQNCQTLDQTIESLSNLLLHDDTFVSDNALRCFATLADRFARKNVDPAPLIRYSLKDVLLRSLHYVSKSAQIPPLLPSVHSTHQDSTIPSNTSTAAPTPFTSTTRGISTNISVVTGLLSTLCRGSAKVTSDLLRSDLPDALDSALSDGDERCILDTMRFLDLLIVLLFEGRHALPRTAMGAKTLPPPTSSSTIPVTTGTSVPAPTITSAPISPTPSDRTQQQIIEYIRARDTQALINHIEQTDLDVNYCDNVGQTMLNWCSAFGTKEMIEYLCAKGADVNRGQRSSSLHYAACFGRPSIVRLLLKYGGNSDLRDEDGRTALDKARERTDEGHHEVVEILQSAHEWMETTNRSTTSNDTSNQPTSSETITTVKPISEQKNEIEKLDLNQSVSSVLTTVNGGDIDMQPLYLKRLLSIFCQLYQNTMLLTIKRSTLRLMSKLLHYATTEQIEEHLMTNTNNDEMTSILTILLELLSSILDNTDDDDDTANLVLVIIKDLLTKDKHLFLEQFNYLGLIWKITNLALSHEVAPTADSTTVADPQPLVFPTLTASLLTTDSSEIVCHRLYIWNEWNFLRNRECLYIWNNYLAIELSSGSNGWFRFFMNNCLCTMYSSGSPETNVDTIENRQEFIEKLQRIKKQISENALLAGSENGDDKQQQQQTQQQQNQTQNTVVQVQTIFTNTDDKSNTDRTINVGNWSFDCNEKIKLRIHNIEGEQITVLETNQNGFIFESNRGTRHTYHAHSELSQEFQIPWSTANELLSAATSTTLPSTQSVTKSVTSQPKSKQEHIKQRTTELALQIYTDYFKTLSSTSYMRSSLNELKQIVNDIHTTCAEEQSNHEKLTISFEKLKDLLLNKTTLSLYELSSSGLVSALLKIFHGLMIKTDIDLQFKPTMTYSPDMIMAYDRAKLFCQIFLKDQPSQAFHILIRKLISILDSVEKLPLYLYDTPSNYGLQIFSKRFKFQLEYKHSQQPQPMFIDRTQKTLKIEPLATVEQLTTFLASMVSKQWFDYPRSNLEFVKKLKSDGRQTFSYVQDFDQNGILYWIGTNGRTVSDYSNPSTTGLVLVTCSETNCQPHHVAELIAHHHANNNSDSDDGSGGGGGRPVTWLTVDLGLHVIPTHYTLRSSRGNIYTWLQSIKTLAFQVSKDSLQWTTLDACLITDVSSSPSTLNTTTWAISNVNINDTVGYRYVKIQQQQPKHAVSLAGFELYGHVLLAVETQLKPELTRSRSCRDEEKRRTTRHQQPVYQHSQSTSAAVNHNRNASKMQSHILRKLSSMRTTTAATSTSSSSNSTGPASSIEQKWFEQMNDLSIPIDLSNIIGSDDPEKIRLAINETLARLVGDPGANDSKNILNLLSQRKSISTPDISNGEQQAFSVASTEQASSAESLPRSFGGNNSGQNNNSINNTMTKAFTDQIARQYDIILQTPLETTIEEPSSIWLSTSEDFLTPIRNTDQSWLDMNCDETLTKDNSKDKQEETGLRSPSSNMSSENNQYRLFTSAQTTPLTTTTHSRQSISSTTESVESICAVTEENNKKNIECPVIQSTERYTLLENDMNASVPNLSTSSNGEKPNILFTAQSYPNLTSADPTTIPTTTTTTTTTSIIPTKDENDKQKREAKLNTDVLSLIVDKIIEKQINDETGDEMEEMDEDEQEDDEENEEPTRKKKLKHDEQILNEILMEAAETTITALATTEKNLVGSTPATAIELDEDNEQEDDDDEEEEEEEGENENEEEEYGANEEEEDEEYDEQLQQQLHGQQQPVTRRNWDDDFVLKRQFSALLPAFDPRPGRTNINQIQDIEVPTTMTVKQDDVTMKSASDTLAASKMCLYIRGPMLPGLKTVDIEMNDQNSTIFRYVQHLICPFPSVQRQERIKKIFEPTYTIVYGEKDSKLKQMHYISLPSCPNDFELAAAAANTAAANATAAAVTAETLGLSQPTTTTTITSPDMMNTCSIEDILTLLRQLYYLSTHYIHRRTSYDEESDQQHQQIFLSKKMNNKLLQQIQDSIIIASNSLPTWCEWLTHSYKFLYPYDTRQLFFRTTSFGTSRSIVWLQERRDELIKTVRSGGMVRGGGSVPATATSSRNGGSGETGGVTTAAHEYRIGRLKIDRATPVDREHILRDAMNLFHYHAKSKSKLEIQFLNEEGTGDGPTLEFYALISVELQQHQLGLWWYHEHEHREHESVYVRKLEGLFPVPYPQDCEQLIQVCNYFSLMGIYFAKCLLDKYLIDMPLSLAFLKMLCTKPKYDMQEDEEIYDDNVWYDGILGLNDLIQIEPHRGHFFKCLYNIVEKRNQIRNNSTMSDEEKQCEINKLKVKTDDDEDGRVHEPVDIEHLCLTFVYSPPSKTYGYDVIELFPGGSLTEVTIDNLDKYVNLSLRLILRDGIRRQMEAFRDGFDQVFSVKNLRCFNPSELQLILCGNQHPSWTLDDLLNYTEPQHGFTRESPGFMKFVNVMLELDGNERKSVVQFITGCSSLPPGGLANLRPRLAVARKVDSDDNCYPSVNTCYHYLKLPDYTTEQVLKSRLMTACKERGFYFN